MVQVKMNGIKLIIYDSISKINREDWNRIFKGAPEGYEFYKAIEESNLKEFCLYYALLYTNDQLGLIAPLFISDFNLDIAVEGWIKRVILAIRKFFPRFMVIRTLFCGSPFGESGLIGLSDSFCYNHQSLEELVNYLKAFSIKKKARLIIFKDFSADTVKKLDILPNKGFFKVNSFPSAINELNFNSLESYIQSLGTSTRKSLRRKLRNAYSQARIEVTELGQVEGIAEDLYRLYLNTHYQGNTKFERLTRDFFISVSRNMQPYLKVFLYYINGKLGAFNLCFVYDNLFIDKFIGFDYDISSRHHLYFVSWCHNIDWCIKNSIRFYQTGQTDYYAKLKLGCRLVPLYAYLRHNNSAVNIALKVLSRVLKPESFDTDIRANE